MSLVPTRRMLDSGLEDLIGHHTTTFNGILYGAVMGLFTNTPNLSHDTLAADLTPPDNPSYVKQQIAWNGPYVDESDRSAFILSPALAFGLGNDTVAQTITGFAVFDGSDSVTLNYAELLPEPVALTGPDDVLEIITRVQPRDGGDWGKATVIHS